MTIVFIGDEKITPRIQTGFWSLDRAFTNRKGDIGLPVRGIVEVSGYAGVGKSTLVYALSGIIASQLSAGISLTDLEEHFDQDFMSTVLTNVGYSGNVYVASGGKKLKKVPTDSDKLEDMLNHLRDDCAVGIVDSIGAISPVSEAEGSLEDASMGRRAKLVAVLSRQVIHLANSKTTPTVVFVTNHVHQVIGGRGTITSGGVVKDYLSTMRIRVKNAEQFEDGSFLISGKVDKNSFGYSKRSFTVFNVVGYGIHKGLSAVYDCIMTGTAKLDRTVRLGDKSYGYMKQLIQQADDAELFQPFIDSLKNGKVEYTVSTGEEDES